MQNVEVQCCHCKGHGKVEHWRLIGGKFMAMALPTDPFHYVECPTCNGFGVVIATELKAVTQWHRKMDYRE